MPRKQNRNIDSHGIFFQVLQDFVDSNIKLGKSNKLENIVKLYQNVCTIA